MYKVFIENKPIKFQINSQCPESISFESIWKKINTFLNGTERELSIEILNESDFDQIFGEHKKIEASGGLVQSESKFLFIKRNGYWDIPKGKLEKNENPLEAAVREIEEECGLDSPKIKEHLLDTWHTYVHKGKRVLKKTYWYWLEESDKKTNLIPQEEEGITEVVYLSLTDFTKKYDQTFQSIIAVVEEMKKRIV